jgi:hypothetical protein
MLPAAISETGGGVAETIQDFSDAERQRVASLLEHRYGRPVAIELADSELQLEPEAPLTTCPTLYWAERGAHFVVCKLARDHFRCKFFYTDAEQFGTGRSEYDDLGACVLALLRVQSDHERERAKVFPGATAEDLDKDDYMGPSII